METKCGSLDMSTMVTTATELENYYKRLSSPKSLPASFIEDRRSVYWDNKIPPKDFSKTTDFVLTTRQEQLVYSKRLHPAYQGDRPSPIWTVSPNALRATASNRITQLAESKKLHPNYQPSRGVKTVIPKSALSARTSNHTRQLAQHKTYPSLPIKPNSEWDWSEWETDINPAAKQTMASSRVTALAEPKNTHPKYEPCRDVQWKVGKTCLSHVASELTVKLARPKSHNAALEDYNPRAWSVSRAALMAQASPRLSELATPLPRKLRAKKT